MFTFHHRCAFHREVWLIRLLPPIPLHMLKLNPTVTVTNEGEGEGLGSELRAGEFDMALSRAGEKQVG